MSFFHFWIIFHAFGIFGFLVLVEFSSKPSNLTKPMTFDFAMTVCAVLFDTTFKICQFLTVFDHF